VLDQKLTP
jgi:hypothetical protein